MATATNLVELTRQMRYDLKLKTAGVCRSCGEKTDAIAEGHTRCFACRVEQSEKMALRRRRTRRPRFTKKELQPFVMRLLFYAGWTVCKGRWIDPDNGESLWWKRAYYRELGRRK